MERSAYMLGIAVLVLAITGCISPQGQPDYTASGALAGGATGAIAGSLLGHSGPAALIGGAGGAIAGGLIGHGMDQAQEAKVREQAPQTLTGSNRGSR